MLLAAAALLGGLVLLLVSADKFVEGASVTAEYWGMSPLLIGMIVIGFGTSAPEMIVSATAAIKGTPEIAIGNAYGSNITNIGLILGLTAFFKPINVGSGILKKELPILTIVTLISFFCIYDYFAGRAEGFILIVLFFLLMFWSFREDSKKDRDNFSDEIKNHLEDSGISIKRALFFLFSGLFFLVLSSRILVWGAVFIARKTGVSDLVIGLTIIATGTSLPELASSIAAIRNGKHDLALGNIIGSNLFNTLAVTGIAFTIHPVAVPEEVVKRDFPMMLFLTAMVFVTGFGIGGKGRINRIEGVFFLAAYIFYLAYLIYSNV